MSRLALLACVALLAGCGGDEATSWNHDPADTEAGPGAWADVDEAYELCAAGTEQSPVDLAGAETDDLPDLELEYPRVPLVVENTGHTIEVPMPEDGAQTLTLDGEEFRLRQFHFHAPSEHTVDGTPADAEVHLVHESASGELAVVGILLEQGDRPSDLVDLVIQSAPEEAGEEVEGDEELAPAELVGGAGATHAAVLRYDAYRGSLTTPPCSEGVRWFVVTQPSGISTQALGRLHELIGAFPGYDDYENNNRPTQPLNDRVIRQEG